MTIPRLYPVWQYHAVQKNGDGWRFMYSLDSNVGQGWTRDYPVWLGSYDREWGPPVYQYIHFQADGDGVQFCYSLSPSLPLGPTWFFYGVAWCGGFYPHVRGSAVPIYMYHVAQTNGDGWRFMFSTNPHEDKSWHFDGVAFYCQPLLKNG